MSGHSKWATIKHQKGAKDKARGKLFAKLIRQVEVAAREGGGDPDMNPTLRTMWNKARDASVPIDTANYEGYAPNGVAVYVETLTDNRNRTGAEIRSTFSKLGGSLAEPGAVAWQFERKGVVVLPKKVSEDDLMAVVLDAGADDLVDDGDTWRVLCEPSVLSEVRAALDGASIAFDSADASMQPTTVVALETADAAKQVLRLIDALDDLDDVQQVSANFDIPDSLLQELEAV
jgi:transcriptional/translational regulatory protein YebC/TACO1